MKILVVAESVVTDILKKILDRKALAVVVTGTQNSQDVLAMVTGNPPDLVLIDGDLSSPSALELLVQIKALGQPIKLGILANGLTGRQKASFLETGLDIWLDIPFDANTLMATLQPYLPT